MIIDNTYFINEHYVPHAKPGLNDSVTGVEASIVSFIDKYSRECLLKSLGYQLFRDFSSQLDSTQENGLKVGSDQKWDDLLNGKEYTDSDGNVKEWRGIRFKSSPLDDAEYDTSFLVGFVYFYFQKNGYDTVSNNGTVLEETANAVRTSPSPKATSAWNNFIELVQGTTKNPNVWVAWNGTLAVDYFGNGFDVSMYQFINESNSLVSDTYEGFDPYCWTEMTQFGI